MRAAVIAIALIALTTAASPKKAEAALFVGQTLTYEFFSGNGRADGDRLQLGSGPPNVFSINFAVSDPSSVVPNAFEIGVPELSHLTLTMTDTQVRIGSPGTTTPNIGLLSGEFFGFRLSGLAVTSIDFENISSEPAGTSPDLPGAPAILSGGETIEFDLTGLSTAAGVTVVYTFSGAASPPPPSGSGAVPEPASLLIFGLGSVGMVMGARRRRLRVTADAV